MFRAGRGGGDGLGRARECVGEVPGRSRVNAKGGQFGRRSRGGLEARPRVDDVLPSLAH